MIDLDICFGYLKKDITYDPLMSALSLGGSWFVKQDHVAESFAVGPEQIMSRHLHCIILDILVRLSQNTNCQKN